MPVYSAYTPTATATVGPVNWPQNWSWPGPPWPPGYEIEPDATDDKVTVTAPASISDATEFTLVADTVTTADVDTSAYDGQMIKVTASGSVSGSLTIKAASGDSYTSAIYVDVTNYTGAKYGFSQSVWVDAAGAGGETVTFTCQVWGYDPDISGSDTSYITSLSFASYLPKSEQSNNSRVYYMQTSGDYLYLTTAVSDGNNRFVVVDKSSMTPSSPLSVTGTVTSASADQFHEFVISGDYAYVISGTANIVVIDISTKAIPAIGNTINLPLFAAQVPRNIHLHDNHLFVYGDHLVYALDLVDPTTPAIVSGIDPGSTGFIYGSDTSSDSHVFASIDDDDAIKAIDISDTSAMSVTSTLTDAVGLVGAGISFVSGNYLYVVLRNTSTNLPVFSVIDITSKSSMSVVATASSTSWLNISGPNYSMAKTGDMIYAMGLDGANYLIASYDISTPSSPSLVESTYDATYINAITQIYSDSTHVYVADDGGDPLVSAFAIG